MTTTTEQPVFSDQKEPVKFKLYRLKDEWKDKEEVALYQTQHGKTVGVQVYVAYNVVEPVAVTIEKMNTKDKKTFEASLGSYFKEGFHICHDKLMKEQVLPCMQNEKNPMAIMELGIFPSRACGDENRIQKFSIHVYCKLIRVEQSNLHWFDLMSEEVCARFLEEATRGLS